MMGPSTRGPVAEAKQCRHRRARVRTGRDHRARAVRIGTPTALGVQGAARDQCGVVGSGVTARPRGRRARAEDRPADGTSPFAAGGDRFAERRRIHWLSFEPAAARTPGSSGKRQPGEICIQYRRARTIAALPRVGTGLPGRVVRPPVSSLPKPSADPRVRGWARSARRLQPRSPTYAQHVATW